MKHLCLFSTLLTCATLLSGCVDDETSPQEDNVQAQRLEREATMTRNLRMLPSLAEWRRRVIYFAMLDRFANGDPSNDRIAGDPLCNNPNSLRTFQGGDFTGLENHLDYIQDLGAGAIWVTPLYKQIPFAAGENCGYAGYWADLQVPYQLEVEPRYGTPAQLDQLIASMHDKEINLILDMVVNHSGYGAQITRQRPDWFTPSFNCAQQGDPEIFCDLAGLPDFDFRRQDVRNYMVDIHQQWLRRFDIDGIRMDTVKHVQPEYFQNDWLPGMRAQKPDLYIVGELLNEGSFYKFKDYIDAGFDGLFNFPLRRSLIDTFAKGQSVNISASRIQETIALFGQDRTGLMVNLLDNHDVPRFLEEIPYGTGGDQSQQRYMLALSAMITLPGVPQIYYGNEIGMYGGGDPFNRVMMPSWAFSEAQRPGSRPGYLPNPSSVHAHTKALIQARNQYESLQFGRYDELWRQGDPQNSNVWSYMRSTQNSKAIVAINAGTLPTDGEIPLNVGNFLPDGTVVSDVLDPTKQRSFTVQNGLIRLRLDGSTSVILIPEAEQAPNTSPQMTLRFRTQTNTAFGQNVYLIGNTPELGSWDLNRARLMKPSQCKGSFCQWDLELPVPQGSQLEYKFVKIDPQFNVIWESGDNRIFEAQRQAPSLLDTPFRP